MEKLLQLEPDKYFHIYNRGHNSSDIFLEEKNMVYFLQQYEKYIVPVADTFAYCLMKNHFHLLVKINNFENLRGSKDLQGFGTLEGLDEKGKNPQCLEDLEGLKIHNPKSKDLKGLSSLEGLNATQQFSNLFNSYAKAFNKLYGKTGEVFEKRFHRIEVTSDVYFARLVYYIHFNPQKHGFVSDFREYRYSSYQSLISDTPTMLVRNEVLKWFGSKDEFIAFHRVLADEKHIQQFIGDNF